MNSTGSATSTTSDDGVSEPALEEVLRQAERIRSGSADGTEIAMARDLAAAWSACVAVTRKMYPGEMQRGDPDDPGYWLSLTDGSITRMVHMPQRAQKVLSKPVNVMMAKRAHMHTPYGRSFPCTAVGGPAGTQAEAHPLPRLTHAHLISHFRPHFISCLRLPRCDRELCSVFVAARIQLACYQCPG